DAMSEPPRSATLIAHAVCHSHNALAQALLATEKQLDVRLRSIRKARASCSQTLQATSKRRLKAGDDALEVLGTVWLGRKRRVAHVRRQCRVQLSGDLAKLTGVVVNNLAEGPIAP